MHTWARHYQHAWEERSGNPRFPMWLRVASLALGKHKANGHAVFRPGEIALALTTVDLDTGELHQPDRRGVRRAITTAIDYGFLSTGSRSTCLVVPRHAVEGGWGGEASTPCPVHDKKATKPLRRIASVITQ